MNRKSRTEHCETQRWLVPGAGNKSATLSLRQTESEQGAQGGAEECEKPTGLAPERSKISTLRNPGPWATQGQRRKPTATRTGSRSTRGAN